jgi:hypothetical protein
MPERSCIACRKKGGKGELVRLVDTPSGVIADYNEKLPGRGAYVCPAEVCIKKAVTKPALSRAFKKNVSPPSYQEMVGQIASGASRKILSLIGIARKSGKVAYGRDSVIKSATASPGGLLIIASDLSGSTLSGALGAVESKIGGKVDYLDKDGLGLLMGGRPVGLVYIADTGLSSALLREFERASLNTGGEY